VVGADGIRSSVRSGCGISARLDYGGFVVWRATIPFPLPPTPGLLTLGGPSQFGIWGLPDDQVYWFASTSAPAGVHQHGNSRPPELFSRWHEPIGALLAATPADLITVTDIFDCPPLSAWSSGRIVLVGDAAHPSMPNMGQGTSQAFEDVAVLADSLARGTDIGLALRDYETRRRRRARAAWSQARMLARLGSWRSGPAVWLREHMMTAVPQSAQRGQLERLFAFRV
jgi:2-polyprenyl-6-methoxyphenol hydroxylase-like FAD-dependent oxidoreductase